MGKKLKIKTLAFQEQDGVVSRCATIAIWTAMHKVCQKFQVMLPSPVEITLAASVANFSGRLIPNEGLEQGQICKAFEHFGLQTELRDEIDLKHARMVRRFIYAYLKKGFPVLVGIRVSKSKMVEKVSITQDNHIITFVGYQAPIIKATKKEKKTAFLADYYDTFYAHDDQTGPFSTLRLQNDDKEAKKVKVFRDFSNFQVNNGIEEEQIVSLLAIVSDTIRLSYDDIAAETRKLDFALRDISPNIPLTWDVYLTSNYDFLSTVRNAPEYQEGHNRHIINTFLPKYVWIARGLFDTTPIAEFVFDATAIHISKEFCLLAYILEDTIASIINETLEQNSEEKLIEIFTNKQYVSLLKKSISNWTMKG